MKSLGLMLAQLMTNKCKYRVFRKMEEVEDSWSLVSNRKLNQMYLVELMEIEVIRFELSPDFPGEIVYDIFVK